MLKSENGLQTQDKQGYLDWVDDDSAKIQQMKSIEGTLLEQMEQKARELKDASEREAIISGALILLVLGVSLVGAFVVARSMIRSLRRLQETATKVAQDRLPELVKQLSESDPQDVDTSVESVGVHSRDEIGQVAAAFDDVHREAVRLAASRPCCGATSTRCSPTSRAGPGSDPAPAVADLGAGVPRGRPGPAVLAVQARPPRDAYAP